MLKFSEVVKSVLDNRQISITQLAKDLKLSIPYVSDLIKGNRRWNETRMIEASQILGITIEYKSS